MLETNGHFSAYGGTGTEPALISTFEGTNDAHNAVTYAYLQSATTGLLSAMRAAAPSAKITLVPDGPLDCATVANASAMLVATIAAGAAAFSDNGFADAALGAPFAVVIYSTGNALRSDGFHPSFAGNTLVGPAFLGVMQKAITSRYGATFRRTFRVS